MNVSRIFDFLVKEYKLEYVKKHFDNCYEGNWAVITYSYFNESGCFTIYTLPERGELDFFYSRKFSDNLNELCQSRVNIQSIGTQIWQKAKKKIFFEYRPKLVLRTAAEAIKSSIKIDGCFFGVKV